MGSGIDQTGRCGYEDPRTGLCFENRSIAQSLGYGQDYVVPIISARNVVIPVSGSSPGGMDTRLQDQYGNLITNQLSYQYWMEAAYEAQGLPDPTLETKAVFSDAVNNRAALLEYVKTGSVDAFELPPGSGYVRPPSTYLAYDQAKGAGINTAPQAMGGVFTPLTEAASKGSSGTGVIANYGIYVLVAIIALIGFVLLKMGRR